MAEGFAGFTISVFLVCVIVMSYGCARDNVRDDVKKGRAIYIGDTEYRCKEQK